MKTRKESPAVKSAASRYASAEDFGKVFTDHMDNLYQLAFLLTADHESGAMLYCGTRTEQPSYTSLQRLGVLMGKGFHY